MHHGTACGVVKWHFGAEFVYYAHSNTIPKSFQNASSQRQQETVMSDVKRESLRTLPERATSWMTGQRMRLYCSLCKATGILWQALLRSSFEEIVRFGAGWCRKSRLAQRGATLPPLFNTDMQEIITDRVTVICKRFNWLGNSTRPGTQRHDDSQIGAWLPDGRGHLEQWPSRGCSDTVPSAGTEVPRKIKGKREQYIYIYIWVMQTIGQLTWYLLLHTHKLSQNAGYTRLQCCYILSVARGSKAAFCVS